MEFEARLAEHTGAARRKLSEEISQLHQRSKADLHSASTIVRSDNLTVPIVHELVLSVVKEYEGVRSADLDGTLARVARAHLEAFCADIWSGWNTSGLMLDNGTIKQGERRVGNIAEAALSLFDRSVPSGLSEPGEETIAREAPVPASDRYVSIADNARTDITSQITALRDAVQSANDVGEEERLIALSELAAFEATILQPRVSTKLIERFVNYVLNWIVTVIPKAILGAVVEVLASRLMAHLTSGA
ncbi:MAG: hypothetical protein ACK41C_16040 [Phenylobacterium sp.]|uniref:hypothetical protein n=1 Tax=Phenylobacterium sp. TaxID=1871053 RepID=UPI00391A31B0